MVSLNENTLHTYAEIACIASVIVSILSLFVVTYIAFKALQYTASPKLRIVHTGQKYLGFYNLLTGAGVKRKLISAYPLDRNANTTLEFIFSNKGHWFAKPAIVINECYINFDAAFQLQEVRFGAAFERNRNVACQGKPTPTGRRSKYFQIADIHLFYGEPPERVQIDLITPQEEGVYYCWIASRTEDASFPIFRFYLNIS